MDQREFLKTKPRLFHRTPKTNLVAVRARRILLSARALITLAEGKYTQTEPRVDSRTLLVDGQLIQIRDQAPLLVRGQLQLEDGFTMAQLVALLDDQVYFWPALSLGLSTATKYMDEEFALIRVSTEAMFKSNSRPRFCRFNSGGPRANGGKPSRRGPDLFHPAQAFRETIARVNEVVFEAQARLPASAEVSLDGGETFVPLFET